MILELVKFIVQQFGVIIKFKMRLYLYIFVEILIMRKELILKIIAYLYCGLIMRQVVFYLLFFL